MEALWKKCMKLGVRQKIVRSVISGVILNTFLNYKIVTLKLQWENADDFYKVPKTQNGICWVSHE